VADDKEWPTWLTWDVLWPRACRLAALAIGCNEAFVETKFRPEVVIVITTFIAVPIAAKIDRNRRASDGGTSEASGS
jgi:hypothetical protein